MHVDQDQVEERHQDQEQEQIHLQVHPAVEEARRTLIDTVDLVSMPDT